MPYRRTPFAPNEFYHLCGRGNYKQTTFLDEYDYARFLFSILHFQGSRSLPHTARLSKEFYESSFSTAPDLAQEIASTREVELVSFALMPNHYHLLVRERKDNGISKYMERVLKSFTKYFNAKHERVGHLFQGPFRSTHIVSNEQLLYASTYIHRNPRELRSWKGREEKYPWSSYTDVISYNRFGALLHTKPVLEQFAAPTDYHLFCKMSPAKDPLYKMTHLEIEEGV